MTNKATRVGQPGWAGPAVRLRTLDPTGEQRTLVRVWLDDAGDVYADDARAIAQWTKTGIVGGYLGGRLFPKDGQAFLDALPFCFKSAYLRAEPMSLVELRAAIAEAE